MAALSVATVLFGCQGTPPPSRGGIQPILFSPNAEPLTGGPLGHAKCEDALSAWFLRIDGNHDGIIDRDEFLADAGRQFERMDIHRAGYVTAADLSEYRAPYEGPQDGTGPDGGSPDAMQGERGRRPPGGGPGGASRVQTRGPLVDTRADPVMSADKTLSFKVTRADFLAQANDVFATLDLQHDGRITREAVLATCKINDQKK
ncbi:hypothetical protein [Telmatospirillum sp.]|uniref:hypothetical protein n=1 Tax=Telmatospirillum sp. TaxID=2079197 RepID=UPI00284DB50C|nr:hypothetical protein [Telmatospirillum sp.]MDR3441130.1 hypothetical protein [Telmatospirillum sp.]